MPIDDERRYRDEARELFAGQFEFGALVGGFRPMATGSGTRSAVVSWKE